MRHSNLLLFRKILFKINYKMGYINYNKKKRERSKQIKKRSQKRTKSLVMTSSVL